MKIIKVLLTFIVVAVIGFFITYWYRSIGCNGCNTPPPQNVYTAEIQRKIELLSKAPNNIFSGQEYISIEFSINDFFKNGSLGLTPYQDGKIWKEKKDVNNNLQWRDILLKNLYSIYTQKFIDQSMYILNGTAWGINDLANIRNEVRKLKSSFYLVPNSVIDDSLSQIQSIILEHDTIDSFIKECYNFNAPSNDFESTFPDVSQKIQASKSYIGQVSNHSYLKNCIRLINELNQVPKTLLDKHVSFLTDKINTYASMYDAYNTQKEYSETIYSPIKNQIDVISNDLYGVNSIDFQNNTNSLEGLLTEYNRLALNYYRNK